MYMYVQFELVKEILKYFIDVFPLLNGTEKQKPRKWQLSHLNVAKVELIKLLPTYST